MSYLEGLARDIIGNLTKLEKGAQEIEHVLKRNTEILIGGVTASLIVLFIQFGMIIYLCNKKRKDELHVEYPLIL